MNSESDLLPLLDRLPANIAAIFLGQWAAARGSWEREDVLQRLQAHVAFMEGHEWDGVRWIPVSGSSPESRQSDPQPH